MRILIINSTLSHILLHFLLYNLITPSIAAQLLETTTSSLSNLTKRAPIPSSTYKLNSILITSSLPSTSDLLPSDPLLKIWEQASTSLETTASRLTSSSISRIGVEILGIPGTGINTVKEAKELQDHLDCSTGKGEWIYLGGGKEGLKESRGGDPILVHKQQGVYASCDKRFYKGRESNNEESEVESEEWNVRESLKWKWIPSPLCPASKPLSRKRFCNLLAHKATLLVGDTPQYSLHDLLLDFTSIHPQTCYGDLYCKQHKICQDVLNKEKVGIEDYTGDERVYASVPNPPILNTLLDEELLNPNSKPEGFPAKETLLRYRRSDGLRVGNSFTSPTYIHSHTGIREINQQWLADSRRSDLVILSKSPLPLPVLGTRETWDEILNRVEEEGSEGIKWIELAWKMTKDVWLPELMHTLGALRGGKENPARLIVYRSNWRSHGDCGASSLPSDDESIGSEWNSPGDGPPPHLLQPSLRRILFPSTSTSNSQKLTNSHTLFYNLQTILQNHILRNHILPSYGIPFLDLETPLSIWRSGMIGGSSSSSSSPFPASSSTSPSSNQLQDQQQQLYHGKNIGLRSFTSGDCTRYCLPSPGRALEEAFLGGLLKIFEKGWAGDEERRQTWTGREFNSLNSGGGGSK